MFAAHRVFRLDYEELAKEPGAPSRVLEFLGAEARPLTTRLRKQNPESLTELVENYSELAAALRGTQWESFLEE